MTNFIRPAILPFAISSFSAACALNIGTDGAAATGGDFGGADAGSGTRILAHDACNGTQPSDPDPTEVRAFPEAEGFGALATGGRGGRVIKVTTLQANGPGSLQEALNQNEPRIIVFAVSGAIYGDIEIPYGNVTIAGQTAPGGGITIVGRLTGAYEYGVDNMIIRHIRVRPVYDGSAGNRFDSIQFSRNAQLIFDHVSASFGVDETIDLYEARDVTIQWSTIESGATEGHPDGQHNYGLINGPNGRRVSVHHNLFVHQKNRSPALANGPAEVVNNVMYNVRHGFVHHNPASGRFNLEGNFFRKGSSARLIPFYFDDEDNFTAPDLAYYLSDNYVDDSTSDCQGSVDNPWTECSLDLYADESHRSVTKFDFTNTGALYRAIEVETSTSAYQHVLDGAGAFPRDIVTRRSVDDTINREGSWGAYPVQDPMEGLTVGAAPEDCDDDGLPDAWETAHGLAIHNPSDNQTLMPSGYPAIEQYINELATNLVY